MKKRMLCLLTMGVLSISMLVGCGNGENSDTAKVPSSQGEEESSSNDDRFEKEYDDEGNLRSVIEYDEDFNWLKVTYYFENGKVESCTEYYANGEKSNSTSYFESGNIKSCSEYDESGKEIKTIIYYENGNEKTRSEYSYHENGEVKKSDLYKDGILSQSRECDEEGNLITYTRVGIETNTGDITYDIYDANDNLIKIEYYDKNLQSKGWNIYEYYENGNKKDAYLYKADGTLRKEYHYDENGNEIE